MAMYFQVDICINPLVFSSLHYTSHFGFFQNLSNVKASDLNQKGTHGYDNHLQSMKPIFFARGPNIKTNYSASPFNSVDIYSLVAELLGVTPGPHNGTLDNTKDFIIYDTVYSGASVAKGVYVLYLFALGRLISM